MQPPTTAGPSMKPRILWIEDSARLDLRNLVGPIYFGGKYDFNLAEDVTTGVNFLRAKEFNAVIVDIRLPPGIDPAWHQIYQRSGQDKVQAQLGMRLLYWMLAQDRSVYAQPSPAWIHPGKVAVFTVESRPEIQKNLDELGIRFFRQKTAGLPDTVLIELIDQVLGLNHNDA